MIRYLWAPLALLAAPVHAGALADLAAIDTAVAAFAGAPAQPVDRRLRLAACTAPLALAWHGARRESVRVECPVAGGWRLFVPLAMGQGLAAEPAAPVIARGDAISITVSGGGFVVSQPGEALESGPVGAWIRVRTQGPKAQPLRARVIRPGVVGMDLP